MKKTLIYITLAGILATFAIISFVIENLFPPILFAGVRLGISNIFILLGVLLLGIKYGYAILLVKILLGSLFSGNLSAIIYSLPAGLISLTLEIILLYGTKGFSIISVSVAGSFCNVTVQTLTFILLYNANEYFVYLPFVMCVSVVTGLAVGFGVYLIAKILPTRLLKKLY